jgi:hypothetical protein
MVNSQVRVCRPGAASVSVVTDVNSDGVVDILDFLFVLAELGPCT